MKTSHTNQTSRIAAICSSWAGRSALAALTIALAASTALAQTITMSALPLRFTVPVGASSTNTSTLTFTTAGLPVDGSGIVNLAVVGVPSGCGATLSTNFFSNNISGGTFVLTLTNDASVAQGLYEMAIQASGAASKYLAIPVEIAYVWSGLNFSNLVSTNFASAGNWNGGVVPPTGSRVVFNDGGGQAVATGSTNIIISANTELGSVRFANTGSGTRAHNIEIQSGATLKISGTGQSFSLL